MGKLGRTLLVGAAILAHGSSLPGTLLKSAAADGGTEPPGTSASIDKTGDAIPTDWDVLSSSVTVDVLRALADQTRGNYEKIRTWKGSYDVRLYQHLPREVIVSELDAHIGDVRTLRQEFEYVLEFAVDSSTDRLFWNKKTREMQFFKAGSNEIVTVADVASPDGRYVSTPEYYLEFSPDERWPSFSFLPEHPEAQGKRAAFRRPGEVAEDRSGDLFDPRDFFGFSRVQKFWEELELCRAALSGEAGADQKALAQQRVAVYGSDSSRGTWYRLVIQLDAPVKDGRFYFTTIWSPLVGYNPVRSTVTEDPVGDRPRTWVQWEWKQVDNVYVPAFYRQTTWLEEADTPQTEKELTLRECSPNAALPPEQFNYSGLGMQDGDLVVDKIEKVVYIMEDGDPQELASFGEKYVPPAVTGKGVSGAQWWLVAGNIVVFITLLVFFLWRRQRRTTSL